MCPWVMFTILWNSSVISYIGSQLAVKKSIQMFILITPIGEEINKWETMPHV